MIQYYIGYTNLINYNISNQNTNNNKKVELPLEMWDAILSQLNGKDLIAMGQTSREFNYLANDTRLWKNLCRRKGIPIGIDEKKPKTHYFISKKASQVFMQQMKHAIGEAKFKKMPIYSQFPTNLWSKQPRIYMIKRPGQPNFTFVFRYRDPKNQDARMMAIEQEGKDSYKMELVNHEFGFHNRTYVHVNQSFDEAGIHQIRELAKGKLIS